MPPRLIFAIFDFAVDEIDTEFGFPVRLIPPFSGFLFIGVEKQPIGNERYVSFVPVLVELLLPVLVLGVVKMTLPQSLGWECRKMRDYYNRPNYKASVITKYGQRAVRWCRFFSRVHATLQPALSVGWLVGRSVGRSHFTFFMILFL